MKQRAKRPKSAKAGVWQKLLDALSADLGKLVSNEHLIKVSGQHNYARRIRELRAEGWDIQYTPGRGYKLCSLEKISKSSDKYIDLKLRHKILSRDDHKCQLCGHKANEKYSDGENVRLEIDHIKPLDKKGKTVESNLWTLCSRCNAGKKSLLAYPETQKNSIISLNLPPDLRTKLNSLVAKQGITVNDLLVKSIRMGIDRL